VWQLYVFADGTVSALPIPMRREPARRPRQSARLEGTGRAERAMRSMLLEDREERDG
jgi:hypothetical protein